MQHLVSKLSVRLIFKSLKVITVESCTAGYIGQTLTEQAGSSSWFAGGLLTYTNQSKTNLAQVDANLIAKYGAVSEQVAESMAIGVHQYFDQCISVAVTGIAGPDGGSVEKPVGTVYIATCLNDRVRVKRFHFEGNRQQIRSQTVEQAILMLLDAVK